ncbi:SDR family NAD(P)-dependent oxidoreductase [Nonomuraea phyllanthi]|uniref:SDR family NAD(P)-dependent oxidoreductase n=1 Tax=Nonomuraea phyllanthi TaxID=2219224 RepID=A0A5C4W3W8_9ACTN|nr:SDR family oxidoreductase [Nonomuraea phyllanthi]KAB8191810.1 SDR family NAD(P)-dependent oxidoreductase [Nonomuraea phyllanthi]
MTAVVLVTGGAGGIGAAVARRFARTGAQVVIADLDETAGQALATEIDALFVPADVTQERDNQTAVEAALTAFGGLDLVHLNAGTGGSGDGLDLDSYRRIIAVNLDGTMYGIRAALPALASTGGGAIVVTSSLAGVSPNPFDPIYSASKHAVIGLVRSLAHTLSASGVTINAICPGFVETPMLEGIREHVLRHGFAIADPDEVAAAVQTIVQNGATGEAWIVQAGQSPAPVMFPAIELSRGA